MIAPLILRYCWNVASSLSFPNPTSRERLNPIANIFKPDTTSLPTELSLNNNYKIVRICGWWQLYQRFVQLSSRFRLEEETVRNSGRVVQCVQIIPVR